MGAERFLNILRLVGMANPDEVMALAQETPRLLTLWQTEGCLVFTKGWKRKYRTVHASKRFALRVCVFTITVLLPSKVSGPRQPISAHLL
jgi:hypothetical protein